MTWKERLAQAKINGAFTDEDRHCAGNWGCCAVGENKEKLEMHVNSVNQICAPHDFKLHALGLEFYERVNNDKVNDAIFKYEEIQARIQDIELGAVCDR